MGLGFVEAERVASSRADGVRYFHVCAVNAAQTASFRGTLPKGSYRYYVSASGAIVICSMSPRDAGADRRGERPSARGSCADVSPGEAS